MHKLFLMVLAFFLVHFLSCSSEPIKGKTPAEGLFLEAKRMVGKKRFIGATEQLNNLRTQYPFSFYAVPAELLQADIYFMQENFEEATAAYMQFRDLHPKHEQIDYVIFRIGESFYQQTPSTFDRDLTSAVNAEKFFKEIVEKYPQSIYLKESKEKIILIQEKIISKEKYIADFYYKTANYDAALWRYKYILENFKEESIVKHSKFRVILSLAKLDKCEDCLEQIKTDAPVFTEAQVRELNSIVDDCSKRLKGTKYE